MVECGGFGILADGRPIRLGRRAFDVLTALIEASRAVGSKNELLSRVWLIEDRTRVTFGCLFRRQTEPLEHGHPCTAVLACESL
jgi:DNA-binding response OmpR family regulator